MTPTQAPDLDSENSVFRRLFSDEQKPREATKAERMERIFSDAKTTEPDIQVREFLPTY